MSQDFSKFAEMEITRADALYPPFSRLVMFEFSATSLPLLDSYLKMVENWLFELSDKNREVFQDVMVLGLMTPPIELIRGRFA